MLRSGEEMWRRRLLLIQSTHQAARETFFPVWLVQPSGTLGSCLGFMSVICHFVCRLCSAGCNLIGAQASIFLDLYMHQVQLKHRVAFMLGYSWKEKSPTLP